LLGRGVRRTIGPSVGGGADPRREEFTERGFIFLPARGKALNPRFESDNKDYGDSALLVQR